MGRDKEPIQLFPAAQRQEQGDRGGDLRPGALQKILQPRDLKWGVNLSRGEARKFSRELRIQQVERRPTRKSHAELSRCG